MRVLTTLLLAMASPKVALPVLVAPKHAPAVVLWSPGSTCGPGT